MLTSGINQAKPKLTPEAWASSPSSYNISFRRPYSCVAPVESRDVMFDDRTVGQKAFIAGNHGSLAAVLASLWAISRFESGQLARSSERLNVTRLASNFASSS